VGFFPLPAGGGDLSSCDRHGPGRFRVGNPRRDDGASASVRTAAVAASVPAAVSTSGSGSGSTPIPGVPAAWAGAGDLLAATEAALGSRGPLNTRLLDAAAREVPTAELTGTRPR
jgi:hypothetical protein